MRQHLIFGLILIFASTTMALHCDRKPHKALKPRNKVDNRYAIDISGNAKSYVPGENYTITLKSRQEAPFAFRFTEFTIVAEPEHPLETFQTSKPGTFQLIDRLTRFNERCPHTVIQTNTVPKTGVVVAWIAPESQSRCIVIRATVFESPDSWFSDDGDLTRVLCEEEAENEDVEPAVLGRCCACDEAKYEVAFQGLWSRNIHPKDFPTDVWTTKFSDIVGASHKLHKTFWNYMGVASDGLKALAEDGDTLLLEEELKEMVKSDDIRTIIKARELTYPNITGTSYTVFRVDRENHLISLVSKITPSPDWIVGVSSLELCLRNCSWVESRTLNLYPWDVGTDDGISYNSPNEVSSPQQSIRRITSNNPNRDESPFFSSDGEPIKPLAKLHLTRQKLYEKECSSDENDDYIEEVNPNCATTKWSAWSPCSANCFRYRNREFVHPTATVEVCQVKLIQDKQCGNGVNCEGGDDEGNCELNDWNQWSGCSVSCGTGVRTRDRTFITDADPSACISDGEPALQETEECEGDGENCNDYREPEQPECPDYSWSEWTPCTTTCGPGTKERTKTLNEDAAEDESCAEIKETVDCNNNACDEEEETETPAPEEENNFGGIATDNHIVSEPDGPVVDCKLSRWSKWSACNVSEPCKKGYMYRVRYIKVHAQNGGQACAPKLRKQHRCQSPCPDDEKDDSGELDATWGHVRTGNGVDVDCVMGKWSHWSPCSENCGKTATRVRTRPILVQQRGNGRRCGPRKDTKACPSPLACD